MTGQLPEGRKTLEEWNLTKRYVVITTVQTFKHRYAVPMDKLQELNADAEVEREWALDAVTLNEVKEFSQHHIGEQILDDMELNEEEVLQLFDSDNPYLSKWTKEQKLAWIRDCWEK